MNSKFEGWLWFGNSGKAVNVKMQADFEIDENGVLIFRTAHGHTVEIEDKRDVEWFWKEVLEAEEEV